MWFYIAEDEFGLPVAEAYRKSDLINKLIDEFGIERLKDFKIKRVFDKNLK